MKTLKLTLFELVSFLWITTALYALVLAVAKIFFLELIILWLVLIGLLLIFLFSKKKLSLKKMSRLDTWVFVFLVALGIALSFLTTPTIFGGRDEGAFSATAIMLSQDHSLKHSEPLVDDFFNIYGRGKALNFPGFYYTTGGSLRTQFLPGFPSWAAVFFRLFGIAGLKFVNFFPFVTFLFSLYLVIKKFSTSKNFPLMGLALFVTFLPVTLFYKFALTELFFGAIIWFSLYLLLKYLEDKSRSNFLLMFLPLLVAPFVRIEAIGIIFVMFLLLILLDYKHIRFPRYQLLLAVLGLSVAASLIVNARFFVDTFKNFATISPVESIQDRQVSPISFIPDDWKGWYMLKIFHLYNIIPLFIMAAAFIVKFVKKKKWFRLVPFFFFFPVLLYVVDANISLDHPWMLRRFTFAVVPLLILYSALFLETVSKKFSKTAWAIFAILFLLNVSISAPLLTKSQNKGLLQQVEQLSTQFGPNDLVLVSQNSSGSGWSLISEPLRILLGKHAIYFFNPEDYYKLDVTRFENVFLVAAKSEVEHYSSLPKEIVSEYSFHNSFVNPSRNPLERPAMQEYTIEGYVYRLEK